MKVDKSLMKIALIEHRGDIARAAVNQLQALTSTDLPIDQVLLLHGGTISDLSELGKLRFPVQPVLIDALSGNGIAADRGEELADQIRQAITAADGSPADTLLHFRDHTLGENVALPGAISHLADAGWPIVLQINTFVEDYQTDSYRRLVESITAPAPDEIERHLYPQSGNIHYAISTQRNRELLASIGVADSRLHTLPHCAAASTSAPIDQEAAKRKLTAALALAPEKPLGVYPVRGVRHENLAEMLLWSAVCEGASFVVTGSPAAAMDRKMYAMWSTFAASRQLPVRFDVQTLAGISADEAIAAADFLFTASLAESSADVFLAPSLAGRPQRGRDLPNVTDDLRDAGLSFPGLSPRLLVPAAAIGQAAQPQIWEAYCAAWGWLPDGFIDALDLEAADRGPINGNVDFARLSIGLQARVIASAVADPAIAAQIRAANPVLNALPVSPSDSLSHVTANARLAKSAFNFHALGESLSATYQAAMKSERGSKVTAPEGAGQLFIQLARYEAFTPCRSIEL